MAVVKGSEYQIGAGLESNYGTPATITNFFQIKSEGLKLEKPSVFTGEIGGKSRLVSRQREGNKNTTGSINLIAKVLGQLWLWKAITGIASSAQIDTTTAYKHTFTLTNELPSFSCEVDRVAGVFLYPGLKATSLQLSGSINNFLDVSLSVMGNGEEQRPVSATSPVYPTNNMSWFFTDISLLVDSTTLPIKEFSLSVNNKFSENRYGTGKTKIDLPFIGREITGSVKLDLDDTIGIAEYQKFADHQIAALSLTAKGRLIEADNYETLKVTLPFIQYTGETPGIDSEDLIQQNIPFDVLGDVGNDEMIIEIINTETTI